MKATITFEHMSTSRRSPQYTHQIEQGHMQCSLNKNEPNDSKTFPLLRRVTASRAFTQ
eukprot:Ihof_evm18s15 gene=Ihof_evmTU18s15